MLRIDHLLIAAAAAFATSIAPSAACDRAWRPTFGGQPGTDAEVRALTVFDDGAGGGPALYAGGSFSRAGEVGASAVAKWDGGSWSVLGNSLNAAVLALAAFDDGAGDDAALHVGGAFTAASELPLDFVARWTGDSWTPLGAGVNAIVRALEVFDDGFGGGPALYAGGDFTTAGGVSAKRIAKWDGTSWSPLGNGLNGEVNALAVFDDERGYGPALYAAGGFSTAGSVSAGRIARWDGKWWSSLGTGLGGDVHAMAVFDDGSGGGPGLYVGGAVATAGGAPVNRIAKWDGEVWSPLGTGLDHDVYAIVSALAVFDDGSGRGPALYVGGRFTTAGGVTARNIAKWDGTS